MVHVYVLRIGPYMSLWIPLSFYLSVRIFTSFVFAFFPQVSDRMWIVDQAIDSIPPIDRNKGLCLFVFLWATTNAKYTNKLQLLSKPSL